MNDSQATPSASSKRYRSNGVRKAGAIALLVLFMIAVIVFLVWFFVIRNSSPVDVSSARAAEARNAALDASATSMQSDGVEEVFDGVWLVDNAIGTFDDACLTDVCDSTFVGFRIDEELAGFGDKTVVGRTPGVTGALEIDGTSITRAEIVVDMSELKTDSAARNNAIRNQAIETSLFPEAFFSLSDPLELENIPDAGEEIFVDAVGELTLHGTTRTETISLTAQVSGDVIVVFGQLGPIYLADYEIHKPTAAVVLSVEDNAVMEFQLFFTR